MAVKRLLMVYACCLAISSSAAATSPAPQPHADVLSLSFSPDGKMLASSGWDGTVRVWSVSTGCVVRVLVASGTGFARSICYHPNGKLFSGTAYGKGVRLWETSNWKAVRLIGDDPDVQQLQFNMSGDRLVTVTTFPDVFGIKVWNVSTNRMLRGIDGDNPLCVAFMPDKHEVVTGDWDGRIRVWDIDSGKAVLTTKANHLDLRNMAVSPDGKLIASGGWSDTASLWDADTGRRVQILHTGGGPGKLPVAFNPDGTKLAAGCANGSVRVWQITGPPKARNFIGHKGGIACVAFSPDGKLLASGGEDGTVRLWNVANGKVVHIMKGHRSRLYRGR